MLFLCLIVSLDDCIAHCLWQANHLSVCTLRSVQIHLLACCWASPLNPTKSTQSECFFFVLSCPWTIASPTACGRRTTFRSARCALCKYICSLAVGRVHSIQPKALKASAFSLSYRVLGRLHRPLPVAGEPPFGLHATLCANTFAR